MGSAKDFEANGIRFLQDACLRLDVEPELTGILVSPSREIRVEPPVRRTTKGRRPERRGRVDRLRLYDGGDDSK